MQVLGKARKGSFFVDERYLTSRVGSGKYGVSKWIEYSRKMLELGYLVNLYEARTTKSKYITVYDMLGRTFIVRFSDHKPNRDRELRGDCDFFCGVTHTGVRNVDDAVRETLRRFGRSDRIEVRVLVEEEQDKAKEESSRRITGSVATASGSAFVYYRDEETRRTPGEETSSRDQGIEEIGI